METKDLGASSHRTLFTWQTKKINYMSRSSVYCVVTIYLFWLNHSFSMVIFSEMLSMFLILICLTFWSPCLECYGPQGMKIIHTSERDRQYIYLCELRDSFIKPFFKHFFNANMFVCFWTCLVHTSWMNPTITLPTFLLRCFPVWYDNWDKTPTIEVSYFKRHQR